MSRDIDIYNDNPDTQFATGSKITIANWLRDESNNYFYSFGFNWKALIDEGITLTTGYTIKDLTINDLQNYLTDYLAENRLNVNVNITISENGRELINTITDLSEI